MNSNTFFCSISQVDWDRRLDDRGGNRSTTTVDGIDCPVEEVWWFDATLWSFKLNGAGLRYEIGLHIASGDLVWVSGPHHPAPNPDHVIAQHPGGLVESLGDDETFVADGVYKYTPKANTPSGLNNVDERMKALALARHETFNSRLKTSGMLKNTFQIMSPLLLTIVNGRRIELMSIQ